MMFKHAVKPISRWRTKPPRRAASGGFRHCHGACARALAALMQRRPVLPGSPPCCWRCWVCLALAQSPGGTSLESRVTDLTGTLTAAQRAGIGGKTRGIRAAQGRAAAVLIVPTTALRPSKQYSIRVAEAWKLGARGRRWRTAPGGAAGSPAQDRNRSWAWKGCSPMHRPAIIDDTIKPLFRQGDIAGGVSAGMQQVMKVVDGEPCPAVPASGAGLAAC